jgi:SAM-dependent methyltransferase
MHCPLGSAAPGPGRALSLTRHPTVDGAAFINLFDDGSYVRRVGMEQAYEAVVALAAEPDVHTVLDVGSGEAQQALALRFAGKVVTTLDPVHPADIQADFLEAELGLYDAVFCSHVLEHQRNVGAFLDRIVQSCAPGGWISITVPPEISHHTLLGHPNQFTAGSLLYHLVMAGVDCRDARALTYGYNASVMVRNLPNGLPRRSWAVEAEAAAYLPPSVGARPGPILSLGWTPLLDTAPHVNAGLSDRL